jgi:dipeptidyl aminopeptidase/acylaminoacyl peptidase
MAMRNRLNGLAVAVCAGAALAIAPVAADTAPRSDRLTLETFLEMETVTDPQISPDGTQILYTRGWIDKMNDRRESALWIMNADGSRNRFLVKGSNALWSPTGDRIAYIAPGEPGGPQIFVRWMDAEGATSQVTRIHQAPANLAWSPDGTQLSFTMLVEERANWPIKMPKAPAGAKWTEPPRSRGLHRQRLPAHLRRSGHRRHAAADHVRKLRSQRHRMDAGRQEHPVQRTTGRRGRLPVA